jgi:hypothetical protein
MSTTKLIRLVSGEEVIAKVVEETAQGLQIEKPAILLPAGQGRLALVPWLPYGEAESMFLPEKVIAFSILPKKDLSNEYSNMTSGLVVPDSKMATPKLTLVE